MTFENQLIDTRRRAALVLVAVVAIFVASDAVSEARRCLWDPVISGRTCPEEVCVALQDEVNIFCKSGLLRSCDSLDDCEELRKMKRRWQYCARARDDINRICWNGGDAGHQKAAGDAWQNVSTCVARIAEVCEDSCPQFEGPSLRTPEAPSTKRPAVGEMSASEEAIGLMIPVLEVLATEGLLDTLLGEGIDSKIDAPGSATCDDSTTGSGEDVGGR